MNPSGGGSGESALAIAGGGVEDLAEPGEDMVEMKVLRVELRALGGALVLLQEKRGGGSVVPMVVGDTEGNAISLRLSRQKFTRPLTHDLLEAVLEEYRVKVVKLEIDDLKQGVFLGRLFLVDDAGRVVELDTRPSDGIALALGADAPIHMSERVVRNVGESPHDWGVPVPFGSPDPPREETGLTGLMGLVKSSTPKEQDTDSVEETPPITLGAGLGIEELTLLMNCWFTDPYEYMFEPGGAESEVSIMGRAYGRFMAGIGGVMHYGSLSGCVADLSDAVKGSYSDARPMAELAGVPLHGPRMNENQPFGFYNSDLIRWGHENLIPDRATDIGGVSSKRVYDVVFARFFRMMAESYLHLVDSGKYERERRAYWRMAKRSGKNRPNGIEWLQERYTDVLQQYATAWDGTSMTPQMAFGFWLRRRIDGTDGELWVGLKKLLKRFDREWYRSLKSEYASKKVKW
ncbi:MAG: bifunctional nuclease family protein [Deltaproteobacteria bacterium]|nr:bifunctional nuclease family protein [Deltaproteobacteria bacterium]